MKLILAVTFSLLLSHQALAKGDPFSDETHACVKSEIKRQFPTLSRFDLAEVLTVATDQKNFEYMIYVKSAGQYADRVFIKVSDGNYGKATFQMAYLSPQSMDLASCF